jgi:antirestriction protein ArdC
MRPEQLKKTVQEAFDRLARDIEAGKSQQLKDYLRMMGRFTNYSFGNMLLILMQRPDAEHVAGFWTWKKLGRSVKKGERGIAILAPIVYHREIPLEGEESQEPKTKEVEYLAGFRTAYVFDVNQTEGRPLAEFAQVKGEPGQYLEMLKAYVAVKGIKLDYNLLPGQTLGLSCGGRIVIKAGMTAAEEFSTLVHELGHEMLHRADDSKKYDRKRKELEAEALAYVVCSGVSLDTNTASIDYIQLYSGDKTALQESLERIQKTASEILWALKNSVKYVTADYRQEETTVKNTIAEAA